MIAPVAMAVVLGWACAGAVLARSWSRRPLAGARLLGLPVAVEPPRRAAGAGRVRPAVDRLATRVGRLAYRVGRRPDLAADPQQCRRTGVAVLGAAVVIPFSIIGALLAGAALWIGPRAMAKRRDRRRRDQLVLSLPEAVDLLAVGVASGLSLGESLTAVGRRGTGAVADELRVAAGQWTVGGGLSDVLDVLAQRVGDPARPLVAVLSASHASGAPIGPALDRLSHELRSDRRRRAEAAARRVPVKLLFPLVGCVLPAFALLTVAPLLASAARSLRLSP